MIAFSPDGKLLATGSSGELKLWDVSTAKELFTLGGHTEMVWSLAFSPDGMTLATGSGDQTVRLWDVTSGKQTGLLEHTERITSVAWAPDGKLLAFGDQQGSVKLCDVARAKELATCCILPRTGPVSVAFSPDGKVLAAGGYRDEKNSRVKVWDVASGKLVFDFRVNTGGIKAVAFCPDGKTLAAASAGFIEMDAPPISAEVKMWDLATGDWKASLNGHDRQSVESLSFSRDGNLLATGHAGRAVKIWHVDSRKELLVIDTPTGCSAALSPDGKELAAGMYKTVKLWDVRRPLPMHKKLTAIPRKSVAAGPTDSK
jgi:WD40 repeat protein